MRERRSCSRKSRQSKGGFPIEKGLTLKTAISKETFAHQRYCTDKCRDKHGQTHADSATGNPSTGGISLRTVLHAQPAHSMRVRAARYKSRNCSGSMQHVGLSRVRHLQALAKIPLATRQRCTAGTADMHACRASLRTLRSREAPRSEATRERVHDARTTPVAEPPRGGRQLSHQGLDTALLGIASKALICTPSPAHLDGLQLTTFEQQVVTGTPVA